MAQQSLRPGEAVVTRFSGTTSTTIPGGSMTVIDPNGTSASIIDLRSPGRPPQGDHWVNEPQRSPVTASQVGQVFGVALDNDALPNIYLTATAAFGLHRTPDNAQWMQPGMRIMAEYYDGKAIGIQLPNSLTFEIVETAPVMKSATKTASTKPAKLDNGVTVNVPEFLSTGERIRVNPATGEYLDRAKD